MTRDEYFMIYEKNIFKEIVFGLLKHPFKIFKRRK